MDNSVTGWTSKVTALLLNNAVPTVSITAVQY